MAELTQRGWRRPEFRKGTLGGGANQAEPQRRARVLSPDGQRAAIRRIKLPLCFPIEISGKRAAAIFLILCAQQRWTGMPGKAVGRAADRPDVRQASNPLRRGVVGELKSSATRREPQPTHKRYPERRDLSPSFALPFQIGLEIGAMR